MGFYVRTGIVEAIGGSGTVLCAYVFLGLLAIAIMQDLARMLRIWPIRGALMAFVEAFVDEEVGIVVGWLYWLAYCCCFAGLTTAIGGLVDSLNVNIRNSVAITFLSVLGPILANLTDIRLFKYIELFFASVKLVMALVFNVTMMSINPEVAHAHQNVLDKREVVFQSTGLAEWLGVICVAVFYTSFSFVGIEVVAVTAMEADFRKHTGRADSSSGLNSTVGPKPDEERALIPPTDDLPVKDPFTNRPC